MEQVVVVAAHYIRIKIVLYVKGNLKTKFKIRKRTYNIFCTYKRQILLCRVCLGKSHFQLSSSKLAHAPPGHHSVCGRPSQGGLVYPEYVVYRGEQVNFNKFNY